MANFNITDISGSVGVVDTLIDKLSNFKIVVENRQVMMEDVGSNNISGVGEKMVHTVQKMIDMTDVAVSELESIQYRDEPCPPCYTAATGPVGWTAC